jgi:hypothetical protein
MKFNKIILSSIASIALVSSSVASDMFVGVEVGNASISVKASANGYTIGDDTSGGYQALKVGTYLGNNRIYAKVNRYNTESDVDMSAYGVGYDYVFNKDKKFSPYIGAYAGRFSYEEKGGIVAGYNKDTLDLSGNTFGISIGCDYDIAEQHTINFGARIAKNSGDDTITDVATNVDEKYELDTNREIFLGYTFNF